jgi:glycosyltransferase GT-like protein
VDYPRVMSEDETMDAALAGRSLARFGDGELRACLGASLKCQRADPALALELRSTLAGDAGGALVCLPHPNGGPKATNWGNYTHKKYRSLMQLPEYGSAFVTRPDSAPWIDRPDYWAKVRRLWEGRDVLLVTGEPEGSSKMRCVGDGAARLRRLEAPRTDAYADAARLKNVILLAGAEINILCLGPTATVLAARLARLGRWAVDLGHIGMFMGRDGR